MYQNIKTGSLHLAFEGEEEERLPKTIHGHWKRVYKKLPPDPMTIDSIVVFMTEQPQLESLRTIHELDRVLNIEAQETRELEAYSIAVLQA